MRNANIMKNFINLGEIIMRKELQAYYQPMYDMKTKKIVACEALARIVKENGEIVPPGKFIPFLDEVLTKKDYVIVKAMIELGHELGLEVVAEGVETKEQVDMLSQIGCTTAQGFYYSRPINVKLLYKQLG